MVLVPLGTWLRMVFVTHGSIAAAALRRQERLRFTLRSGE